MESSAIPRELLYPALVITALILLLVTIRVLRGGGVKIDVKKDGVSFDFPDSQKPAQPKPGTDSAVSEQEPGSVGDIKDITITTGNVNGANQDISIGHNVHSKK